MYPSLASLIEHRAQVQPNLKLFRFLHDGEHESSSLTCAQLHSDSLSIASSLLNTANPRDRVLLLSPPGIEFIRGFSAIQYAGMIATTTYAPHPRRIDRTFHRLEAIVDSCQPKVVLVTEALISVAQKLGLPYLVIEQALQQSKTLLQPIESQSSDIAFLQYTSGSTRTPRGVTLSHANLLDNLQFIAERFEHTADSVGVIWLPPYHDMGLIGGILEPLYVGFPVILLNPLHVLQRPIRWLQAISHYHGTTSGGPNFAFDLCVDQIAESARQGLDLSSWQVAFCGAEAVRPQTWRRFSEAYQSCGFRANAFFPCYGLAEATLMVTGSRCLQQPTAVTRCLNDTNQATEVMSSGSPSDRSTLMICHTADLHPVAAGEVGEICVSGPSVAAGYWNDTQATEETFVAIQNDGRRWLRTGDLGFLQDGQLFVTGRRKELIILAGRNVYPQDVEWAVESAHSLFQPNGACAFSIERNGSEQIALIVELRPGVRELTTEQKSECIKAIKQALASQFDVTCDAITFVRTHTLPRTTSGKKRRHDTRALYLEGEYHKEESAVSISIKKKPELGIRVASPATAKLQRRLAWMMVVVPIVGLIGTIVLTWGWGVEAIDLFWLISLYIATVIGIEVGFHRHFTHRSFQATPLVRWCLGIMGSMAGEGPVLFWVATHRRHHAFSDQPEDPHSPCVHGHDLRGRLRGLWHAHVGWLFKPEVTDPMHYAPDVFRDRTAFRINAMYPLWVVLGLALPAVGNWLITGTLLGMFRGFLWGGLVRMCLVHHATWSVNSICHLFGSRPFTTRDSSRNNLWLLVPSLGGSWHNHHHAYPTAAHLGFRTWQCDPSGFVIRLLQALGVAWDVKTKPVFEPNEPEVVIGGEVKESRMGANAS